MMIDDLLHAVNGLIEIANGELVALHEEPVEVEIKEQAPGINLEELEAMGFYEAQLQEVELGIKQNLPVQLYAQNCYNWMQMKEIRLGMLSQVVAICSFIPTSLAITTSSAKALAVIAMIGRRSV